MTADRHAELEWHAQHSTQPPIDWTTAAPVRPRPARRGPRTWLAVVAVSLIAAGVWLFTQAPREPQHGAHVECHLTADGAHWFCTDMRTYRAQGDGT